LLLIWVIILIFGFMTLRWAVFLLLNKDYKPLNGLYEYL